MTGSNRLITSLYREIGRTLAQTAELADLSQYVVAHVLTAARDTGTGDADGVDKRRKLQDKDLPAIAGLLLACISHGEVAQQFG